MSVFDNQPKTASMKYVLITPARNEAQFIGVTIQSMIHQTAKPLKWIIVSDGSTDGTDDIVVQHAKDHCWIELVRRPERTERHFAGKVMAFNEGYSRVRRLDCDVIGNLDADISFDPDYFGFLMSKFAGDDRLGVAGTPFREGKEQYNYKFTSIEHVSGACQLFRRQCFEEIGGYIPIKGGGIDLAAVTTARMKGWHTRTFPEKICFHHRTIGTAGHSRVKSFFNQGVKDSAFGAHPLWELPRSMYQMSKRPFLVGGGALLAGFLWGMVRRRERVVPAELVAFRRREQMQRLKQFALRVLQ